MSSTIFLGLSDSHWTDKRPVSRKDPDWLATQSEKILSVFRLAENIEINDTRGACAILHAGDLFHQPKGFLITRTVDQWLMQVLKQMPCPILAIPGNHDMHMHRLSSLGNHPYGCLESAGFITSVMWPNYVIMGEDPLVLVTGKEFSGEGPEKWCQELRQYGDLIRAKETLSQQYQKPVFVMTLSHNYWGPIATKMHGEPVTAYSEIHDTGIDMLLVGHDHSCLGIHPVEEDGEPYFRYIIQPGALVRGTISDADIKREPKIAVIRFQSEGKHEVFLVSVPHSPIEEVFDDTQRETKKREKHLNEVFIEECRRIETSNQSIEVVLSSLLSEGVTSPRVSSLTRQYLTRAEAKETVK